MLLLTKTKESLVHMLQIAAMLVIICVASHKLCVHFKCIYYMTSNFCSIKFSYKALEVKKLNFQDKIFKNWY